MKKTYLCPQADIQKVETGILCASGPILDPGSAGGSTGGNITGPAV